MTKPTVGPRGGGKSEADWRFKRDRTYYIPIRIKEGLKQLGDSWESERDFARRSGVSSNDLPHFRDQFKDHVIEPCVGSKAWTWVGTKKFADKLRAYDR